MREFARDGWVTEEQMISMLSVERLIDRMEAVTAEIGVDVLMTELEGGHDDAA